MPAKPGLAPQAAARKAGAPWIWSDRAALWIVATGVIAAGLYFLREPLTQFAMALILWLAIDGLAETLDKRIPFMPRWLALPLALVLVLSLVALIGVGDRHQYRRHDGDFGGYEVRLNQVIGEAYASFGTPGPPPTVGDLIAQLDPAGSPARSAAALHNLASDAIFTLIFLGVPVSGRAVMSQKFDFIFRGAGSAKAARDVLARIRLSMERYLWVQTVMSLIITALTYVTLTIIGLRTRCSGRS